MMYHIHMYFVYSYRCKCLTPIKLLKDVYLYIYIRIPYTVELLIHG